MKEFLCKHCTSDISHKPSNRRSFCGNGCFREWVKTNHPHIKRVEKECLSCGVLYSSKPHEKRKFCSKSCSCRYWMQKEKSDKKATRYSKLSVSNKKAYKDGKITGLKIGHCREERHTPKVELFCKACGIGFIVPKNSKRKYCSRLCSYKSPNRGGYKQGSVQSYKSGYYNSKIAGKIWLDSSYEFIMAEHLDSKGYNWKKNYDAFPYVKGIGDGETKNAKYVPDFYIYDLDLWVETKGYETENDRRKIDQFPYNIRLIGKKEIFNSSSWGF